MGEAGGLALIKKLVANFQYTWSGKVERALEDGYFSFKDIECCVASGKVHKIKKDRLKDSVGEKIYVIKGKDLSGYDFYTQGKIMRNEEGQIYFFISAHS